MWQGALGTPSIVWGITRPCEVELGYCVQVLPLPSREAAHVVAGRAIRRTNSSQWMGCRWSGRSLGVPAFFCIGH